jgi:hypothetical protein
MMALAAAAALATSPSSVTSVAANSVSNGAGAQTSAPAAVPKAQPAPVEKVYCATGTMSGSRIVKRECKTKEQWAKAGVSLDDLMNPDQQ